MISKFPKPSKNGTTRCQYLQGGISTQVSRSMFDVTIFFSSYAFANILSKYMHESKLHKSTGGACQLPVCWQAPAFEKVIESFNMNHMIWLMWDFLKITQLESFLGNNYELHSTRLIFCNFVWDTFSGLQKQVFPFFTVLGSLPELHFLQVIHSNSSLASGMLLFWTLNKLDASSIMQRPKRIAWKHISTFPRPKIVKEENCITTMVTKIRLPHLSLKKVWKISLQLLFLFCNFC